MSFNFSFFIFNTFLLDNIIIHYWQTKVNNIKKRENEENLMMLLKKNPVRLVQDNNKALRQREAHVRSFY